MKNMKLCRLTETSFRTVGTCHDMLRPEWEKISDGKAVDFFSDVISLRLGSDTVASLSLCRALPREPLIEAVECHCSKEEAILPRDADIAMACAHGTAVPMSIEARPSTFSWPRRSGRT